jgi:hypothetical protein
MYGMIDIETLSTRNDACVIAIGMAAFDDNEILFTDGFQIHEKDWHGHIDPLTVKWWMGQEPVAQDFSFRNPEALRVDFAADRFKTFAQRYCQKECWANSPQFDLTILRSWWDRIDKAHGSWPIAFRNLRDTRTLWSLADGMGLDLTPAFAGAYVAHNPIDDAVKQARAVMLARKLIKGTRDDVR